MLKQWFSNEFTLTKWHLGMVMIAAGMALAAMMLLVEVVGTDSSGLGAVQWLGIGGGMAAILVGLTLLPCGDQRA